MSCKLLLRVGALNRQVHAIKNDGMWTCQYYLRASISLHGTKRLWWKYVSLGKKTLLWVWSNFFKPLHSLLVRLEHDSVLKSWPLVRSSTRVFALKVYLKVGWCAAALANAKRTTHHACHSFTRCWWIHLVFLCISRIIIFPLGLLAYSREERALGDFVWNMIMVR